MDVTGHKSMDTLRGYVRDAELFKDQCRRGVVVGPLLHAPGRSLRLLFAQSARTKEMPRTRLVRGTRAGLLGIEAVTHDADLICYISSTG
jgi:hypothetical protein